MPGQDLNRAAAVQLGSPAPQQQQPAEDLTQAPPRSSGSEPSPTRRQEQQQQQPQGTSPISTGNDAANAAKPRMKAPPPLPARAAALAPPPGIQQGPAQSESPPAEPKQRGASDGKQPVPASALAEVDAAAAALLSVQPTQFPTLEATPPLPPPPEARPPADASSTEDVPDMSASAEAGDTLGQDLIDNYSWHRVLGTPHPPLAPPPEAARTEQPVQQQPIRVWTREVATRTAAGQAPVSRRMAHEFLAAWRAEGRYPDKHIEDLTDSGAFNWVAYLAGHPYAAYVFGRGGICKFEIRYLRPQDTNTRDFRCDFVAYRLEGDAIRLHPSSSAEAIPVWSPDIRALAIDWSLADPLPGYGTRTREEDYRISVFRHLSDNDRMNGKRFQAWLTDELIRPELRNITEPAADGSWFP
jgi:hypothetical protein